MFKRGDVVQHKQHQWIGAVLYPDRFKDSAVVEWFEGRHERQINFNDDLVLTDGYEFEAALALGDTAKVLDLYHASQSALEPFAAYGKLKRVYPDEAVFTIAYDREGNAVKILFSDFTRAAAAHPDARANTHATPTSGGAGGIAEIMEDHRPQTLFGKPIVYTELTDAAKVDGQILRVIQPGEVTIKPRFKKPAFGYRVQYVAQDGLTRIGRIGADSDEEALQVFAEMVSGATDLKVVWSIPLTDADGSVW